MTTKSIILYDSESDNAVELEVSAEEAIRAENDLAFATTLLQNALQNTPTTSTSLDIDQLENETIETETDETDMKDNMSNSVFRWVTPCVLLLLDTYKSMDRKFQSGKHSQKKIWEDIAKNLIASGYVVTGPQCAAKLRSLKKTYKAIKDHNAKSGNDRRTWPFFEIMDDMFSMKAWCNPVSVASSTGLSQCDTSQINNSDSRHVSVSNVEPAASKMTMKSLLMKRLQQKEEHEENKNKRFKLQMEMDNKLLAALEKLSEK